MAGLAQAGSPHPKVIEYKKPLVHSDPSRQPSGRESSRVLCPSQAYLCPHSYCPLLVPQATMGKKQWPEKANHREDHQSLQPIAPGRRGPFQGDVARGKLRISGLLPPTPNSQQLNLSDLSISTGIQSTPSPRHPPREVEGQTSAK